MLYRVERPTHPNSIFPAIEMVDAATAKCGTSGTLIFCDETDALLRAFAHGQWLTVAIVAEDPNEILGIGDAGDLYAEATKATASGF